MEGPAEHQQRQCNDPSRPRPSIQNPVGRFWRKLGPAPQTGQVGGEEAVTVRLAHTYVVEGSRFVTVAPIRLLPSACSLEYTLWPPFPLPSEKPVHECSPQPAATAAAAGQPPPVSAGLQLARPHSGGLLRRPSLIPAPSRSWSQPSPPLARWPRARAPSFARSFLSRKVFVQPCSSSGDAAEERRQPGGGSRTATAERVSERVSGAPSAATG